MFMVNAPAVAREHVRRQPREDFGILL